MSRDPLLQHLMLLTQRAVLFLLLALTQGLGLWLWFWMHFEGGTAVQALGRLATAWPVSAASFHSVQALGLLWIGVANTAILYLLLGRWWAGRADVLHRRGSRFLDDREEQ